jgi:hypothetical protein
MTGNLFKVGTNLLGAGVVLKLTKEMSDKITKEKYKNKEVYKDKRRYFRI